MTWIDEDREELNKNRKLAAELAARNQLIANDAETVYNNLWDEIRARIAEAKQKGLPQLITNGLPFRRVIIVPMMPRPTETSRNPMEVIVELAANKLSIIVSGGSEPAIRLALDRGDDNVTCLKHNGEYQSIGDAAKLILRPLLFPELFRLE
jgi:hypothetical protein